MSDMEQIVRPFQSPTTIDDKKTITILPKVAKSSNNVLEWGAPGAPPTVTGLNFTVKQSDKTYTEKSRTTTDVRIQNPDDPNQYIIEKRMNSVKFDIKDTIPSAGGTSGSSNGQVDQSAYKQSSAAADRLNLYSTLISQGISPSVASSMAYGNTDTGSIPQEKGPDSANYTLKADSSSQ